MKTFWTTFYSYKGGVGRSLALANVAALLVQRGHRVVLLDFDLEAPGLDTFDEFAGAKEKPGIVEYVAEFQRRQIAPEIKPFVHAVKLPEHLRGRLWIMPAGRKDKAYNHLLARTRWAELFNDGLGAPFIENWKLSIEQEFNPDYVLIDSRTGLTEVGGVCTTAFPDLVVMLFGLNEQNVQGTATVARYIREAAVERQPQLHFVATPVPNLPAEKKGLLRLRFEAAEKILGVDLRANSIRYWAPASLTERLFVLDDSFGAPAMVHDHRILCEKITEYNRNGLDFLTGQTEESIRADDIELAERLSEILLKNFPNRAEAVFLRSRLARLDSSPGRALELAENAFELDPTYAPPFDFLCAHFRKTKQTEKVEALCERVLALGSRLLSTHRSDVLMTLAELQMSVAKYSQAAEHYEEILKLRVPSEDEEDGALPITQMIDTFNAAEANRRAGHSVSPETWRTIISLFEKFPAMGILPTMTANHCQAMHIPYAMVGDVSTARECLRKALKASETLNDLESIFSVQEYRFVNREQFRTTTEELNAAVERGELWDGTKLPAAHGENLDRE
jgi:MinD-like ATPase involved in chromosome partitioning or flagellar assembly